MKSLLKQSHFKREVKSHKGRCSCRSNWHRF